MRQLCLLLSWMMDTHEGSMCQTCQLRVSSPENISFLLIGVTIRTIWCPVRLLVVVVTIVLEAAHATRQQGTQCPLVIALRLDRNIWRSLTGHDGSVWGWVQWGWAGGPWFCQICLHAGTTHVFVKGLTWSHAALYKMMQVVCIYIYVHMYVHTYYCIPVVPHKAVAEVSE